MDPKKISDVIDHLSKELATQLGHVAPQVWLTLLSVKRMDSLGQVITAGIWLVVSLTVFVVGIVLIHKRNTYLRTCAASHPGIALAIVGVVGVLIQLCVLTNYWLWVGMYAPNIAVAHDIIQKVTGQ